MSIFFEYSTIPSSHKDGFFITSWMMLWILWAGLGVASMGYAEVYKGVDENGQVIYSDKPNGDAAPVTIPKTNIAPPVKMHQETSKSAHQATDNGAGSLLKYTSLNIVKPNNDTTIHHGAGHVSISLKIRPELQKAHKIQFLVDGSIHKSGTASSAVLENVSRGDHTLKARIVDHRGKILKSSASVTIHVIRPTYR